MCESLDEETIVLPIVFRCTRRATKCLLSCRDNGCATNNPFKANHPLLYRPIRYRWTEGRLAYLLLLVVCSQGLCNRAYEKFDDVPLWNVFSFVFETQCWWPQDRDKNWIYYDGQTVGGTTTVVAQQWRYVRCASTIYIGRKKRETKLKDISWEFPRCFSLGFHWSKKNVPLPTICSKKIEKIIE